MCAWYRMLCLPAILLSAQQGYPLEEAPVDPFAGRNHRAEFRLTYELSWTRYIAASSVALLATGYLAEEKQPVVPLLIGSVGGVLVFLGTTDAPDEPVFLDRFRRICFVLGWGLLAAGLWKYSETLHEDNPLWIQSLKGVARVKFGLAVVFAFGFMAEAGG